MGLFSRTPRRCECCQQMGPVLHQLEQYKGWRAATPLITHRQRLCAQCLSQAFEDAVRHSAHRVVVVKPMLRYGGYGFFALQDMQLLNFSSDDMRVIRELLPMSSTCELCKQSARARYVDWDIYVRPKDAVASGLKMPAAHGEILCASCVRQATEPSFRESTRGLSSFLVPSVDIGEGFWTGCEA